MNMMRYKTRKYFSLMICFALALLIFTSKGVGSFAWADETAEQNVLISEQESDAGNQSSVKAESDGSRVIKPFRIGGGGGGNESLKSYSAESTPSDSSGGGAAAGISDEDYPQKVETVASVVYEAYPISIISSTVYYGNNFYLQFTGLDEEDYQVVLTGAGLGGDGLVGEISGDSKDLNGNVTGNVWGVLFEIPEDAIEDGESKVMDVQVKDGEERNLFSEPAEITTRFVVETGGVLNANRYYDKNVRKLYLTASIPAYIEEETIANVYLLNAQKDVVAADGQRYDGEEVIPFYSYHNDIDERYSEVFGNFGFDADTDRTIGRDWTNVYTHLYKMDAIPAGQYSLKIVTKKSGTYVIPDAVTVVDGTIIYDINVGDVDGYSPATVGGSLVYVEVDFANGLKDDLRVVVKDDWDQVIGEAVQSKYNNYYYYINSVCGIFRVQLESGRVFEAGKEYYVEITRKDHGPVYFYEDEQTGDFGPASYFSIYRHKLNNGLAADFTFKTVNADGGTYRLTLSQYYDTELSEETIAAGSDIITVKFRDAENNIIRLEPDEDYRIIIEADAGGSFETIGDYWFDTYGMGDADDFYIPDRNNL